MSIVKNGKSIPFRSIAITTNLSSGSSTDFLGIGGIEVIVIIKETMITFIRLMLVKLELLNRDKLEITDTKAKVS